MDRCFGLVKFWLIPSPPGYISNAYYDFGSILAFIEEIFTPGTLKGGGIYPAYNYADYFAYNRTPPGDLSDFFCFPPTCQTPPHQQFASINLYNNSNVCSQSICQSNYCDATCFIHYPGSPAGPGDY